MLTQSRILLSRVTWRQFWNGPGGGGEVLAVAYPLVLSHVSYTVQTFADRLFLTWYSPEAMAGAVAGLFTVYGVVGLFQATGEYLTTFVAQYHGAGKPERIGAAVWQGIYLALAAGLVIALLSPLNRLLFSAAGHGAALVENEVLFSGILLRGSAATILMVTLASFFSGRGETRTVLVVNVVSCVVNVVLAWVLIFGKAGFPALGVAGAAWAVVLAQVLGCILYLALIFSGSHRVRYALGNWRPEPRLLLRILRYGLPAGLQYSLELFSFALFLLIVGRLGTVELAATGIAFNLNALVFIPIMGLALGVSAVVGRHLGAGNPEAAERSTWSGFGLSLAFMLVCCALYLFAPGALVAPYAAGADPTAFAHVGELARVLLRFVAFYSIFDMMNLVFSGGLKGAGDTRYPMTVTIVLVIFVMLVPAYVLCVPLGRGIFTAWACVTAYAALGGPLMLRRFRRGAWKSLRVIEGR